MTRTLRFNLTVSISTSRHETLARLTQRLSGAIASALRITFNAAEVTVTKAEETDAS